MTPATPKRSTLAWLSPLLAGWGHLAALFRSRTALVTSFFVTSIARAALQMATILLVQRFLVGAIGGTGGSGTMARLVAAHGQRPVLVGVGLLFLVLQLLASAFNYANTMIQLRIAEVVELQLAERVIRHLLTLSIPYFDRQSHGDIVLAVSYDVTQVRLTVRAICLMLVDLAVAAALLAAVVSLAPRLAVWTLLAVPLAVLPILVVAQRLLLSSLGIRLAGYVLSDVILEVLRGIRVIKAYRAEGAQAARSVVLGKDFFRRVTASVSARSLGTVMNDALMGVVFVGIIVFGGREVMEGRLAWPSLLAFVMGVRNMYGPLNSVSSQFLELQAMGASLQRVDEILAQRPHVLDRPDAARLLAAPQRIAFDHVSFGYGETSVLSDVCFEVRAGETIGIVGPSGSGKTTLLNLLLRFYDCSSGRVLIDGRDVRELRLADVYQQIALVTQEPFLFSASARDNIRVGRPDATAADVEAAARAAYVHEEMLALPERYDTRIGIGGRDLSGGQRQRVSVARALLANAPILVLDEATSSLDSIAETEVQRAVDRLMVGRTSFVVAHRLSTLRNADRILVLDRGAVVGFAPHADLLRDCDVYRRLCETQQMAGSVEDSAADPREPGAVTAREQRSDR